MTANTHGARRAEAFPTGYPAADAVETVQGWPAGNLLEDQWFRELLARLWRHKWLIFTTICLGTLATAIAVSQITPRYSAGTKVLVGIPRVSVPGIAELLRGLRTGRSAIESEMEVLTSQTLIAKAVDRLGLVNEPEFNPALRPPSLSLESLTGSIDPLSLVPADWRTALLGAAEPSPPPTREEVEQETRRTVRDGVQRALSARVVGRSRVLEVTATSEDPGLAAAIANTLSELYLVEQLEAKFEATRRAADWLNERVAELRGQVEASERAVEDYRRRHGLIQGKDTTVTEQQITEINTQLILARTKTAEAGARLRQIRSLVRSEDGVDSAAEVLASPLIHSLRERETDVARRAAEMATEYGARHPKMINIRAELADVRSKIEAEVRKIVRGLRNELEVAQTRERTLERNLEILKTEATKGGAAQGQLRVLEREAAANRALFDTLLARYKEAGQQEGIQRADARIISRAEAPRSPSSPRTMLIIGAALAVSAFLGVLLVFLLETLDRGFRSSEQVEGMTGVGALSLIPMLTRRHRRRLPFARYVLERPASSFAEALRTLHTGILLSSADTESKSVLISSSLPSEGKTTISIALALLVARSGRTVLLVDADLRRGQVAEMLDLRSGPGLAEVLSAPDASLEDAIQRDPDSGLHVLTAGARSASSSSDLLGSAPMTDLMSALRHAYDLIVIDSPPVHLVSDARILSTMADRTVYVVRWEKSRRDIVRLGLRQLMEAGADVAGVALNMVNVRKNARYGYADSGYYYGSSGEYRSYYTE